LPCSDRLTGIPGFFCIFDKGLIKKFLHGIFIIRAEDLHGRARTLKQPKGR
jgi:hypothetical protein